MGKSTHSSCLSLEVKKKTLNLKETANSKSKPMEVVWCRTEEQQTVVLAEEPLADVSSDEDGVGTGQLRQQAAHLQLEALRLAGTCDGSKAET